MSKIYKALEKAEKERERAGHPPYPPEGREEKKGESHELRPDVSKIEPWVSDRSLVSLSQPGSLAAEQFRKLRTYLLREKSSDFPKTIMVTSATSAEGKTFVSANLAAGIVQDLHAHALMVDCDMRSPQLSQWFGLNGDKGLSDYLAGDGKLDDLLKKTGVEKLSILSGGGVRDNPTELIASKKMEALINELKTRYRDRYIIFDSTPLLATTEPEVLAKLVDGIIIVIRAGVTPRETVKQAIASLDKEKIIGFVLNGLEFKSSGLSSRYFGSNEYYYTYGYGYGKGKSKGQSWLKKILPFRRKNGS
jgi:exopolysaccharide/PEP-CTERM locus tyrosine autokinase